MVEALLELPPPQSAAEAERNIRQAIKVASQRLMNTAAVCRRHYVHPQIAQHYQAGDFFALCQGDASSERSRAVAEQALMRLLYADAATG